MTISILVGPSFTGKSETILRKVVSQEGQSLIRSVFVILPDRYLVAQFRQRLAKVGGALGARVDTFGGLYRELLALAGTPTPLAPEPVVERLLRASIDALLEAGQMDHYARIAHTPGFLQAMRDRIAELKRALIQPEAFLEQVKGRAPGLFELGRLYQAYQEKITQLAWADADGLNWLATATLEADPSLGSGWGALFVDGFDNFYPSQIATLRLLGERLPELTITLSGDLEHERPAHRRFHRTLETFREDLPGAVVEGSPAYRQGEGSLGTLERSLFEPEVEAVGADEQILRLELPSPMEEAREALRWLKARHLRHKVPIDACAIITPHPETYRPLLREAAEEFGLPLRFTHGEPLTAAPAIDALLDLLDVSRLDWPRRLTIDALGSPYFDLNPFGLVAEDATRLEDVSQFGQIVEGLGTWLEVLERLSKVQEEALDREEDLSLPHLPRGAEAERLCGRLLAFSARLEQPDSQAITGWVAWLEDLLDELKTFEQAETQRDTASLIGLREQLRALVLGEQVARGEALAYAGFLATLRAALESGYYSDDEDWRQPSILVLRVLEVRGLRFDSVAILGLSEGQFPEVEREDPFLPETLRVELSLEPRLNREQGGLFYQAVTRADHALLLTRPYLAPDGERWEASPFWDAVERIFQGDAVRIQPEAPRPLAEAASSEELLFWAVRKRGLPGRLEGNLSERWSHLQTARDVLAAREIQAPGSPFEGDASALQEQLQASYGSNHVWSASRLEAYGTCPFDFYIGTALGLQARQPPELGLDPAQLGSLLHAILEQVYQAVDDPSNTAAVLEALPGIAEDAFQVAPETYGFRPNPMWELEKAGWLVALQESILAIMEEEDGWVPVGFEEKFGIGDIPPLELNLGKESIRVRGVIDRVDRNPEGELRIVDYKTGSSHLAAGDLHEGRRLQLPIYALGASDALGLGHPVEGFYWTILAAKRGSLRLSKFKIETDAGTLGGPQAAFEVALGHADRIVAGVRSGDFQPVAPRGGCPRYCPAVAWCWKYEAGWSP